MTSLLRFMPDVKHERGGVAGESRSPAHRQLAPRSPPTFSVTLGYTVVLAVLLAFVSQGSESLPVPFIVLQSVTFP